MTRTIAIHVFVHVVLSILLHTALVSLGVPELLVDVAIVFIAVVVAHAIEDYMNKGSGG